MERNLLDAIGIPYNDSINSKGCKILFTSREETVCLLNKCKHPVNITTLTFDEAMDLFRNIVGTTVIDSLQDDYLVQEVCKKCAGLPLLIQAVGKALKFRSHSLWEDALYYLEKGNFKKIAGIDQQAYACVKLSIDRLPENAKLCLLLCSLFPKDSDISIGMLITIATGSRLKPSREYSTHTMVDIMKSSSLSLEGKYIGHIKLHDIVRDVASSLAFSDPKYAFLRVRCGSRLLDNVDFGIRKLLRSVVEGNDCPFHKDQVCPDLHSLWLHCNYLQKFSGSFFSMFVNFRFLMLQSVCHFPEHFSLQCLVKLRELFMIDCDIKEKDLSLLPENLHSLCIRACDLPRFLDLPNLKKLRKLEIEGLEDSKINEVMLVPNTISNLCSLEVLRIPNGYCYFGDASDRSVQDKICGLNLLTSLEIKLSDFKPCEGTTLFSKLLAYNICVSGQEDKDSRFRASFVSTTRLMKVYGYHSKCLESLMVRAEELSL
ncbi:putative disease resistance protein At1g61190 [Apium graveolens]|uniref:putative disease resistance protein At1g61190 n=1 Tax=Apium graveolens TaxID=4045 RepID=UPI003D7B0B83